MGVISVVRRTVSLYMVNKQSGAPCTGILRYCVLRGYARGSEMRKEKTESKRKSTSGSQGEAEKLMTADPGDGASGEGKGKCGAKARLKSLLKQSIDPWMTKDD